MASGSVSTARQFLGQGKGRTPLYLLASFERRGDGEVAICAICPATSELPMGIAFGSVVDIIAIRFGSYGCRANAAVVSLARRRLLGLAG